MTLSFGVSALVKEARGRDLLVHGRREGRCVRVQRSGRTESEWQECGEANYGSQCGPPPALPGGQRHVGHEQREERCRQRQHVWPGVGVDEQKQQPGQ